MFVNLIFKEGDEDTYVMHECATSRIKSKNNDNVLLTLEGLPDRDIVEYDLPKKGTQVYLMNNEGKTISCW